MSTPSSETKPILCHTEVNSNIILRQPCRKLSADEIVSDEIQTLIQTMKVTMQRAPGVGLAAPQIGLSMQLVVIEDAEERLKAIDPMILSERQRKPVPFHALINPVIIAHSDNKIAYFEGCLSCLSHIRIVPRYESVTVTCLNEKAEPQEIMAQGWYARILQHEIDHLSGVLNIDRAHPNTEVSFEDYKTKWMYASRSDIHQFYFEQVGKHP